MDRHARLGAIVVGGAFVAIALLAIGLFAALRMLPKIAPQTSANANLVIAGPFTNDFEVRASMYLPPVRPQPERPSVQLALVRGVVPVFQGGLMRTPRNHFRLCAFVAYPLKTRNALFCVRNLSDGPHLVAFHGHGERIDFLVDGARLFVLSHKAALIAQGRSLLLIGTSVGRWGYPAQGEMSDIEIQRDGDGSLTRFDPTCVMSNGGIHIDRKGSSWFLGGVSDPKVPNSYNGCGAIFGSFTFPV